MRLVNKISMIINFMSRSTTIEHGKVLIDLSIVQPSRFVLFQQCFSQCSLRLEPPA